MPITISGSGTMGTMAQGGITGSATITAKTAVTLTNQTSVDFTSIPSWVRRITIMLNAVSTNGTSVPIIQIGDAGGIENTGYLSAAQTAAAGILTGTTGYPLLPAMAAASSLTGNAVLCNISGNAWVINGDIAQQPTVSANVASLGGAKTLSDTLDRIRLTTVNGTDQFDAGTINILYE